MELNNSEILNNILKADIKIGNLDSLSSEYFDKYTKNNKIKKLKTPCYIIDEDKLGNNIYNIKKDLYKYFSKNQLDIYYPVKINNHKFILKKMLENNIGLEIASIDEYKLAMNIGAEKILYYAPGKKIEDLEFFIKNSTNNHIIHIDSFNELSKLSDLIYKSKKKINIGVRIYTDYFGEWQKYGINLNELGKFIEKSNKNVYLNFLGIHFHTSRNKTSEIYTITIENIGKYLKTLDKKYISQIKYIDFGGGFEKNGIEGTYYKGTNKGQVKNLLSKLDYDKGNEIILLEAQKIEDYFKDIYSSIENNILSIFGNNIKFFTEPGRLFVSDIMHILSKVEDVKDNKNNIVILDSGVNMIGWQRGEFEYFPVINLSSNKLGENKKALMYGNLCTTWDHWGYYCYTDKNLEENDLILLSNQGTLSYSLAQKFFINKLPKVYIV